MTENLYNCKIQQIRIKNGFSLVELSIVLVILGLLTGGILAGQSLIRAAELRSVSTDFQRYKTAVYTFRDKYFALPGDMPNAVKFWTAQTGATTDGITSACAVLTSASTGSATCNGNGDGMIGGWDATMYTCSIQHERYRAWQHLANAGLIEGQYTGANDPTSASGSFPCRASVVGSNIPRSRVGQAGYLFSVWGDPLAMSVNYKNTLMFGGQRVVVDSIVEPYTPVVTTQEAWNIDTKMDDGKPYTGAVYTFTSPVTGYLCAATDVAGAAYGLDLAGIRCMLLMNL